jgi:hypothetical protein
MFDHIGLRVRNLGKAKQLYATMLAPLGHVPGPAGEGYAEGGAFLLDGEGNNVEAVCFS